jgi:hypothetical protein
MEPELGAPTLIESWKLPDQPAGGWAGTASPGMRPEPVTDPEMISWEEMPQIPSLWVSEQPAATAAPPPAAAPKTVRTEPVPAPPPPAAAAESSAAEPAAPPPPETPKMPPPVLKAKAPEPVAPLLPPRAVPAAPPSEISSPPPLPPAPPAVRAEASAAPPPAKAAPRAKPPASAPALPPGVGKLIPEPTDFSEVTQSADRDSIAAAALSALGRRFDRGAIFAARPDAVAAWGVTGNVVMENFRAIEIPWTEPSVFLNVRYSRTFYLGPLPPLPRHTAFARALGGWPAECVVYPVLMRDRPVAFLYAEFSQDRGATPMDLAYLRGLASATSSAFASAIRQKKREI